VLHCKLRSLGKGGRQNGFISFGPDPAPEHLVHCGVYIKAGQYVIIHGGPGGSEDERVTKDATFDASKTFDVTVAVDLVQRSITLTVDGVALKAPLRKPWKAIGYVGYGAHSAATDFSTLEAKGE